VLRNFAAAMFCMALAGCASPGQIAASDDAQCRSYGAQPGSDAYVSCRTQLTTTRTMAAAVEDSTPMPPTVHTGPSSR
jgi:hypothetical protein